MAVSSKRLAKHYGNLTPRERFSLIVAAGVRCDAAEQERLKRSSPTQLFRVPTYQGYAEAFSEVACLYLLQQLETGVHYWKCLWLVEGSEAASERLWHSIGLFGHQFVTRREAWELLCAEYEVSPNAILDIFPGLGLVQELDDILASVAFTPQQASFILRDRDEDLRAASAGEIYEAMCRSIEEAAAAWA